MAKANIRVDVDSKYPVFMEVDPDEFGKFFAGLAADDQVAVFRAMIEHMNPHPTQWDYIAIELEKPENKDVLDKLRWLLFEAQP
jgi:hypothetical protein